MHVYHLIPDPSGVRVNVIGSTRAGLLTAAVEGIFAAAKPRWTDGAIEVERTFARIAPDFSTLLADVLNEATSLAETHHEGYTTVRFTLITDTKAEGAFVGKAVNGFSMPLNITAHPEITIVKNAEGNWETTITLK